MFLPRRRPSNLLKKICRSKCFSYRKSTRDIYPVGRACDRPEKWFNVQVFGEKWDEELELYICALMPSNVEELESWIERGKALYEEDIYPEALRDRIDPLWLRRVSMSNEDSIIRRENEYKSNLMQAEYQSKYDELGFASFLNLSNVYIDPTRGLICLVFYADLDVHFENHCYSIIIGSDGTFVQGIDQTFSHYAEHCKY